MISRSPSIIHVHSSPVADLGGVRGVRPHPPWRPSEKFMVYQFRKVRTADSTIIIITNFYLAASSHEIFLTVGGREGMKGLGALQTHQLPHPPCKNPGSATAALYAPRNRLCLGAYCLHASVRHKISYPLPPQQTR